MNWVVKIENKYHILSSSQENQIRLNYTEVYAAPEGVNSSDGDLIDIVDGKAVVNQARKIAKDQSIIEAKTVQASADQIKSERQTRLKVAQKSFSTLDTEAKDQLLKDLLEDRLGI